MTGESSLLSLLIVCVILQEYVPVSAKLIGIGGIHDKIFYYDKTLTDWTGSSQICKDNGLRLAVVGSGREFDFLKRRHSNPGFSGAFWVQDTDASHSHVWDLLPILSSLWIWEPSTCLYLIIDSQNEEQNKLRSTPCHLHKMYTLCETV